MRYRPLHRTRQHPTTPPIRPSDGRAEAMPWDLDGTFARGASVPLWGQKATNTKRVIELPGSKRLYYGHLRDLIFFLAEAEQRSAEFDLVIDAHLGQ